MKGISLATESIIIIILAVLVLAALLIFFGQVWIPGSGEVVDKMNQAKWCGEYVRISPNCDVSLIEGSDILEGIKVACRCPENDNDCVQSCCRTWCVGVTTTSGGGGNGGGPACTESCEDSCSTPVPGTCPDGKICCQIS